MAGVPTITTAFEPGSDMDARQEAGHDELVGIWRIVEAKASAADLY
jgi:hypothetical protein